MSNTDHSPTNEEHFNMLSWFSAAILGAIVVTSVITSYLLAAFLEEHLLRRDAAVMNDFVARIAKHHDPRGYFAQSYSRTGETLNNFFVDITHMPDVARINAIAPDGTIVWSSDQALIGRTYANQELTRALGGELAYKLGNLDESTKAEHMSFQRPIDWFAENYIPIKDSHNQQIVGVVEIYRIPLALAESISQGRRLVWACISASGVLLFISLFWIVRRGQQLIRSQQNTLLHQARHATIGEMASSVAHSIRNPIASIRSSAELALDGPQRPEIEGSLKDIITEVDRFDGWIRELLTFTNGIGERDATSDLHDVVTTSLQAHEDRAGRSQVQLRNEVPDDTPRVRGDSSLIAQVVNSLVANSLDAMPHGGRLVVDAVATKQRVRLSLTDTGFGIPSERLHHLFDPLVSHKNGGLGIGLALARQIVHRYSGDIDITSTPGAGTTVVVQLPIVRAAA